jgi:small subunit ribosomal protein S7
MARTSKYHPRETEADSKYRSVKVAKLINRSMKDGEKTVAMKQVYTAFDLIQKKLNREPLDVFEEVLRSISPQMEVRSRRVGGAAYQVPMPVRPTRAFSLAVRWLVDEARKRPNATYHTYAEKLAAEMMDALRNEGGSVSKRINMHKLAESNKAFSHFRW